MVNYVIEYDILSAIITIILFIAHLFLPAKNKRLRRVYIYMIVCVFLCCVFDVLSSVMLMHPSKNHIYNLLLYFALSVYNIIHIIPLPLVAYYTFYSISDRELEPKEHSLLGIPAFIYIVLVLVNSFTGILFNVENGIYSRGKFLYLTYIIAAFYLLGVLIYFLKHFKRANWSVKFFIYCYASISTVVLIIQYFFPNQLLECAGMVVILLAVHFAIQSKDMIDEAVRTQTEIAEAASIANKAKTDFLANVSHEIRTPINTMLGMNHLIMKEADSLTIKRYAQDSKKAGEILMALVDEILDYSKIESKHMIVKHENYDVEDLVRMLTEEMLPIAKGKKLEFVVNVDPIIPKTLIGDITKLRQVIVNLLSNAIKFTKRGYVELNIRYNRIDENNIMLKVSVKDSGIGIKNEDILNITSRFERIDVDNNRSIEGMGLGLSIVSEMLKLMDTTLECESRENVGSTFSFSVKQAVADNVSLGQIDWFNKYYLIEEEEEQFAAPSAFVLVVDDNEMNLTVLRKLLKANEIKVVSVESGAECIAACKKIKFDLIFMDHMMPHMNGEETLKHIRGDEGILCSDVPVIALTANALSGMREKYIGAGFDEYLSKPIDYGRLQNMLIKFISRDKIIFREM